MKVFLPTLAVSIMLLLKGDADALNVKVLGVNYDIRKGPANASDSIKCKSASEVEKDMASIKQVANQIRIHSLVECNQAELVLPAAKKAGLTVHLTVETSKDYNVVLKEKDKLASLIDSKLYDENVVAMSVGNNAVQNQIVPSDVAIGHMNEFRNFLLSVGIHTPVSMADTFNSYLNNARMGIEVDFISINYFPISEGGNVDDGIPMILERLRKLADQGPEKVVITATGWSSWGSDSTANSASPKNQAKFFSDLTQMANAYNMDIFWYSAFNSQWRLGAGGKEVDANFGIFKEDNTMKPHFQQLNIALQEPRLLRNEGSKYFLDQDRQYAQTYVQPPTEWPSLGWLFSSTTQQLQARGNFGCLVADMDTNDGVASVGRCVDDDVNQKWAFKNETGQLLHVAQKGFCLDLDPVETFKVRLSACSSSLATQKWAFLDPASIYPKTGP